MYYNATPYELDNGVRLVIGRNNCELYIFAAGPGVEIDTTPSGRDDVSSPILSEVDSDDTLYDQDDSEIIEAVADAVYKFIGQGRA